MTKGIPHGIFVEGSFGSVHYDWRINKVSYPVWSSLCRNQFVQHALICFSLFLVPPVTAFHMISALSARNRKFGSTDPGPDLVRILFVLAPGLSTGCLKHFLLGTENSVLRIRTGSDRISSYTVIILGLLRIIWTHLRVSGSVVSKDSRFPMTNLKGMHRRYSVILQRDVIMP